MNLRQILMLVLVCMLIASGSAWSNQTQDNRTHTAVAMIEVLSYAQPDPLSLEPPVIDVELQREFRRSLAMLMTRPGFFERLVKREKVKDTGWFRKMGADLKKATKDLRERTAVDAHKDSSFVEVVVACAEPNDSVLIADEMVELAVASREAQEKARLEARMKLLEGRRDQIQKALTASEMEIEDIRKRCGHADLDDREYLHPAEARLIRMEERRDDILLEILEQDVVVTRLPGRSRSSSLSRTGSRTLEVKLLAVEKMYREACKAKDELYLARDAYKRSAGARARHERVLEETELLIDKLHMMHESPEVSRMRPLGRAWIVETP